MTDKGEKASENEENSIKEPTPHKKSHKPNWGTSLYSDISQPIYWGNTQLWPGDKNFVSTPIAPFSQYGSVNPWPIFRPYATHGAWEEESTKASADISKYTLAIEEKIKELYRERQDLLKQLNAANQQAEKYRKGKSQSAHLYQQSEKVIAELKEVIGSLQQQIALGNLFGQVNDEARNKLVENEVLKRLFTNTKTCHSYVVSIDIRRSTELMLKAKSPLLFQDFIVGLCTGLSEIILNNYGIFDKFTGDGILAFYPDFFSGYDAGLMAIKSSLECQSFFNDFYTKSRKCFTSVLKNIGLGIGIDCGEVGLLHMTGSYTVVGNPVVYACRFSGAKAGDTVLNQTAFEEISSAYKKYFDFEETSIDVKHEGEFVAYKVSSNGEPIKFRKPNWDKLIRNHER